MEKVKAAHIRAKSFVGEEPEEKYMREALKLAKKAASIGEVPIGCVIEYRGEIIARGYNRRKTDKSTLSHAEDIEKAIEINENQMKLLNDKLERDKEKLESLKKELQEVNKTEILKEKKETYNSYLGELEESRKKAKDE